LVRRKGYFFDFLSLGEKFFLPEKETPGENKNSTSKFIFQLKKEYFEPNEIIEDNTAIDLIFRQIINQISLGKVSCGSEGAITALAAHYYVSLEGKIEADFVKK